MANLLLGQSGSVSSVMLWVAVLLFVVFIGAVVIFKLRRQMLERDDANSVGSSGLLDHLHQMQKSGQIDAEEFAKARSAILRRVQEDFDDQQKPDRGDKPSILDEFDIDA